jgi:16S rRNA processing protein RimM
MASKDWLELGRVGSPYGIKGWVHVQSFADPPQRLLKIREWNLCLGVAEPLAMKVVEGRTHGSGIVARLDGIEDRNQAARLQGARIEVARSALPKLRRRQFYQADLVGLPVSNQAGAQLGTIDYFAQTPGGDVMVVKGAGGQEHWVPATPEHLAKVDLEAGYVLVDWPASPE